MGKMEKNTCVLEMANRRTKLIITHYIWGILYLLVFNVILCSFGALVSNGQQLENGWSQRETD